MKFIITLNGGAIKSGAFNSVSDLREEVSIQRSLHFGGLVEAWIVDANNDQLFVDV